MERISFPPYPAVAMIVSASQASNKRQFGNKYFLKVTIMKKYISLQNKQPVLLLHFLVPRDPLQAKRLRTSLLCFPQICGRFLLNRCRSQTLSPSGKFRKNSRKEPPAMI